MESLLAVPMTESTSADATNTAVIGAGAGTACAVAVLADSAALGVASAWNAAWDCSSVRPSGAGIPGAVSTSRSSTRPVGSASCAGPIGASGCALADATLARLMADAMNALAMSRARGRRFVHSIDGSPLPRQCWTERLEMLLQDARAALQNA